MRLYAAVFTALLVTLTAAGCKTTPDREDGSKPVLDGPDVQPTIEPRDDLAKVPVSMWSPGQRRATAGYYYLVAEYMTMKDRDTKKSLPVYEAAYGLDPNPFLGGKMLSAKAQGGDRASALLDARKMVLLYPRDAQLRLMYGEMLTKEGATADAIEQLERAIELDKELESAFILLTEVYTQAKEPGKALVVAKELTKNNPGSIAGWAQLSRLLIAGNQYKEALVPARRAWEMQSSNPHLAQIYAIVLQLNGKTKQAIRIYEQLYRLDPTDEELTSRMVDLYREIGNLDDALELLNEMSKGEGKGKPAIEMQKALVLWELKRLQEASDLLNRLAKENPESDRLKYLAAIGLERLEKMDEAVAAYRQIPDQSPFRFHADFRTVVILKGQKKYDEALALAKTMLTSNQADWDSFGIVGGVYADANRFGEAVAVMNDGYAKFPDKPRLLFLKGVYQEKAGDRDGSIETMRKVIEVDPTNSSAYNFLGYMYAEKGENLDEAEKLISKALELKPNDGFYLDSLGWVHYQRGDLEKALPILEKASKMEPKEGVIMEHVGDAKVKKGDNKGAKELYKKALAEQLDPKDKERIEGKLKELGN